MFKALVEAAELWTCPSEVVCLELRDDTDEAISGPKYSVHLEGPSHSLDLTEVGDADSSWDG